MRPSSTPVQMPVGVDHHVLGRIARNGDDGQFGRGTSGSGSTGGGCQRTGIDRAASAAVARRDVSG